MGHEVNPGNIYGNSQLEKWNLQHHSLEGVVPLPNSELIH